MNAKYQSYGFESIWMVSHRFNTFPTLIWFVIILHLFLVSGQKPYYDPLLYKKWHVMFFCVLYRDRETIDLYMIPPFSGIPSNYPAWKFLLCLSSGYKYAWPDFLQNTRLVQFGIANFVAWLYVTTPRRVFLNPNQIRNCW